MQSLISRTQTEADKEGWRGAKARTLCQGVWALSVAWSLELSAARFSPPYPLALQALDSAAHLPVESGASIQYLLLHPFHAQDGQLANAHLDS